MLLDVVDRGHQLARLGRQGRVEAGEELLGGDEAEVAALGRDGDGRGKRRGDLGGRHVDRYCVMCCGCGGGAQVWLGWVNTLDEKMGEQGGGLTLGKLTGQARAFNFLVGKYGERAKG